ncbi:hypothetical protein [Aeromonas veronii]|uniref:hypothetical protein n=1 Tax=Aeromonas veronii TaxID=654 RepID=UPI002443CC73|nr:hypothetical protein [Aeromonas veronii]
MADWALVFPVIMQGLSLSSLFFVVLLAGAGLYMYFASRTLRMEEDMAVPSAAVAEDAADLPASPVESAKRGGMQCGSWRYAATVRAHP